ncbi:MAG: flagellar filament capping protein FliD [Rickettsiales bacterium]|nr:flagellar filament capping protein FliD [Rickettsiales bacterium]
MVTSINLGGFFESDGKTVLSGSASGLDTESLINALAEARRLPAVQLEERLESNATLSEAYGELDRILTSFQDAANFLRNPPGVGNEAENIFEYRGGTITSSDGVAGSNYLNIVAEPGASITNYEITVDQLATQNVKVTDTFALADEDTQAVGGGGPFNAGTLTFGPNAVDVEFEAGDTLNEVVAKFNAVKDLSEVEASIIKVADGQFRLSLKTTGTGTDMNYDLGVPAPPTFLAGDAIFHLDANDVNGDGDYGNNPGADQLFPNPIDISGSTTVNPQGAGPTLDVDGTNTIAAFDFAGANVGYNPSNTGAINTSPPFQSKTFAFAFETGADVSGTQTIYEQGGSTNSMGLFIAPDPGNGNAATLFATVGVDNGSWPGNELKTLNLGTVNPSETYTVVLDFDATANPTVNDPANTFTGYVNGVQMDQVDSIAEMPNHSGGIGIGYTEGGTTLPDGSQPGGDGQYFEGKISEVILTNTNLSTDEFTQLDNYLQNKYQQPIADASLFNVGFAITTDAVDAEMTIDGTTITRQTNSIDDVITDITFNLVGETPPAEDLDVEIQADTELAKSAIFNFVDAYNEVRIFAARQNERNDDGTTAEEAVLASSNTLRSVVSRVNSEMASIVDGITGGDPDRLADIGLNFEDFPGDAETPFTRNIITVDEAELDSALSANFEGVRRLFEFDFISDDPSLTVFERTNALNVADVDLNIDQTNGVYEATFDDGTGLQTITLESSSLSGGGVVLRAAEGTALEGLTLIYASTDDATVNLNLTQGIGDRVFNTMEDILTEDNGLLTVELESIASENERMQEEITRIDEIVAAYRDRLLKQFSALEAAITQANTLLQSIAANNAARNNNG